MRTFFRRALVKNGKEIVAQRLLVDPVTLNLGLIRSLSPWNHEVPDIEVQGFLKSVKVIEELLLLRAIISVMY